jgi:glycosyltransferase involved in cell wall biosynthesis
LKLSVIIPTRAPNFGRLNRTLLGLRAQTLPPSTWETLLVDNASPEPVDRAAFATSAPPNFTITREPLPGLTLARLHGIARAQGEVLVFVDDDNVLTPQFLEHSLDLFDSEPRVGAAGGPVLAEWETPPPTWTAPFHGLLALRDLGSQRQTARGGERSPWPTFAPVGAGLIVRKKLADNYAAAVANAPARRALDRTSTRLSSGGDCDLVFTVLHGGADVVYDPRLEVTHLIPSGRLSLDYLARLNRGIMRSWVRVLALHGQCPWPPISKPTVPLRAARAWLRRRAWKSPADHVRWAGDLGQFEGQADLSLETAT